MHIDLDGDQVAMLEEILNSFLSDLRMEISNTDLLDFREQLKSKERFVKGLLERLDRVA